MFRNHRSFGHRHRGNRRHGRGLTLLAVAAAAVVVAARKKTEVAA